MSVPSGVTLAVVSNDLGPAASEVVFAGSGTYTAADFTIDASDGLGFEPGYVMLINLTDRVTMEQWVASGLDGGNNAKGLKSVAAGTRTYEASGLSVSGRTVTVDVSVALLTDNDDFILVCRR